MAVSCMRNPSDHNYRNSSFIVDLAVGQVPRSTERVSSLLLFLFVLLLYYFILLINGFRAKKPYIERI